MGEQGDPRGDGQEFEIWPYEQTVYAQPSICPNGWHIKLWAFDIQTDHLISVTRTDLIVINKKRKKKEKRTFKIVELAVLTEHRIILKECEKIIKVPHLC